MNIDLVIEEISKIESLTDKLNYYNKNVASLIKIDNHNHEVGFGIGHEKYKLFCLCSRCKHKFSKTDFEIYKNLRNQETQKVVDFFESTLDYKTKIEYYFQISEGFSKTTRILYFVPDNLEEINNEISYQKYTINITPKDENEKKIIEVHLKEKLINHTCKWTVSLSQFTYEKRVETLKKYLKIRKEDKRRAELIQSEYDNINLSKIEKNEVSYGNNFLIKILSAVEDIMQDKHIEDYTEFSKIEITILAKDVIRYEEFLNSLPAKFEEEKTELSNEERNTHKLNQYYNSITNRSIFKEAIINNKDDLYYYERTTTFIENRNKDLAENQILSARSGWLQPFNRKIKNFLDQTVSCYKLVMEWKDQNTNLHASGIELRMSKEMDFFRQLPDSLRKNYDNNNDYLVLKMREYYLNGFQMMLDFLKNELLIDLKKTPFQAKIDSVIDDVKNAVDYESLKLALSYKELAVNQNTNVNFSREIENEIHNESNRILKKKPVLSCLNKENNYKTIIDIINYPSEILMNFENDDYLGLDEEGIELYKENVNPDRFDVLKDINEPFSNLENLTIELMNNTKHQKVLDGYLKLIFREFTETAVIIIDYCNEYIYDSNKKAKNFPKDLEYFFYSYSTCLIRYYEFIIEFLDTDFLKKENKIIAIDEFNYQTTTFPKVSIDNENIATVFENIKIKNKVDFINPEPLIFKNYEAFLVFKKYFESCGNTKENLVNYSFLYHKMQFDGLIHKESKQIAYFDFLSTYDINIDRIKKMNVIGKKSYREQVYNTCKK